MYMDSFGFLALSPNCIATKIVSIHTRSFLILHYVWEQCLIWCFLNSFWSGAVLDCNTFRSASFLAPIGGIQIQSTPHNHSGFFICLLPTDSSDANTIQCFGASQFCSDVSLPLCGLSCSCSSSNSRYSFLLAPLLSSYIDKGQTAFHIVTSKKRYCDIKLCSYRHVESSSLLPSWISHLSNSPLLRPHHHEVNMALLGCRIGSKYPNALLSSETDCSLWIDC